MLSSFEVSFLREVHTVALYKVPFILGPQDIYQARISRKTTVGGTGHQVRFWVMVFTVKYILAILEKFNR